MTLKQSALVYRPQSGRLIHRSQPPGRQAASGLAAFALGALAAHAAVEVVMGPVVTVLLLTLYSCMVWRMEYSVEREA